jgi:hypothetical protein
MKLNLSREKMTILNGESRSAGMERHASLDSIDGFGQRISFAIGKDLQLGYNRDIESKAVR